MHLKCRKINNIKISNSHISGIWACSKCYFKDLLFANLQDINQINDRDERSPVQILHSSIHLVKLKEYEKHLSLAHLNQHSIISTFDVVYVTLQQNPLDIITVSEIAPRQ